MPGNGFVFNQTMLRIKDPERSLPFYRDVLGMTLLDRYDFADLAFSLYFLGYPAGHAPEDPGERVEWVFAQPALLELTHNWDSERQADFVYHDGNSEPRGFGHIGLSVPDVHAACARFEELGVPFVKRPDDGAMKGLAFIKDPDGYWIEILAPHAMRDIIATRETGAETRAACLDRRGPSSCRPGAAGRALRVRSQSQ